MKFFIASPWRNKEAVKELESALVLRGHVAWSFLDNGANLATGNGVMEEFKQFGISMMNWESDPLIDNIFKSEIQALKDCETLILLEPSGHSSLAEAGIAYGMGKRVALVGLAEHPEVVHLICENRYPTVEAFLKDIDPCPLFMRKAFTLIELLVVIAIIAILAVVVVLTLNPAQMLAQSRDANRLSDMATMNSAINLYNTDQSGVSTYSLGVPSTTYISIYDPAATSTLGTNCSTMGLPATSTGWTDQCPASSTLRSMNSQGWLPVNFSKISAGTPFGSLPIDPTNNTSSLLYYTYAMNGSTYELTVPLESQKYLKQDLLISDTDPAREAIGSNPTLVSQEEGLVGYWNFDEGNGSSTIDQSSNANNGTWAGTPTGTSGYYSAGKVGNWAGTFDGSSNYINAGTTPILQPNIFTVTAWIEYNSIGVFT